MLLQYISKRFQPASLDIIEKANAIIAEYAAEGMSMTLRQIYYQFIARDWFPDSWIDEEYNKKKGLDPKTKNTIKSYDKLQELLSSARLAGLVSWEAMIDPTRALESVSTWGSAADIISVLPQSYKEDAWAEQKYYVEVWVEKEALAGVFRTPCEEERVPFFCCRGYTSQSEQWRAGQRLRSKLQHGYKPVVLHFGDHDPSGLDMTRDNRERLTMFADGAITFKRLALNMNQVKQYKCPPNPTKLTDCRSDGYIKEYGDECWELDALEPRVIRKMIAVECKKLRDQKAWDETMRREAAERETLTEIDNNYERVRDWLRDGE